MLICNNCNTQNDDGTIKCISCNMKNNFTYVAIQSTEELPIAKTVVESVACTNCGCKTPGDGKKCKECNFPLHKRKSSLSVSVNKTTIPKIKVV